MFPLVDRFRTGLQEAYAGTQLSFLCTLTHVSGVGSGSVEEQSSVSPAGEAWGSAATNSTAPVPPKTSTRPARRSGGRFRKVRR